MKKRVSNSNNRVIKDHRYLISLFLIVLLLSSGSKLFATEVNPSPKITASYDCIPPTSLATIQPIQSGLWSETSTWPNGNLPTANDDVIIPQGIDLIMVGTCRAKSITVNGKLSAVNDQPQGAWIDLETESIVVGNGGFMEIGTESQPYHADKGPEGIRCQITLTGNKINNAPASHKAIMVMGGGRLELHGKKRMSWTNLSATANAGASQISLKEAVDWEIGDKIALTATGLATNSGKAWNDVDEVEITAISDNGRILTLASPLQFKHIGGSKSYTRPRDGKTWIANIEGEVGLLSHYIKIQGDMSGTNEADGFGGHIMLMKNSTAHAENIELFKMGQKAILGRYPFHWHLNEDKAQGSYLRNSSVHKSFNRAVTIHGTDYVTVDGVFAYDHIGHGIFLEDGAERFNTIKNNVVFVTRRPKPGEELTPSDNSDNAPQNRTPASYWITNPNNYFENNVAAGTEGTGFWFAFPEAPLFASGDLPYYQGLNPSKEPLGSFEGFVAHTCMNGWDVFDRLNPDHSIKKNFGWDVGAPQNISKGMFYGNDQAIYCGLGVGGTNEYTVFNDCVFSDNKTITMLAGDLTIENSLFNAHTDLGVFSGVREFFRFYDGPGRHIDCHFEGWDRSNSEMIKQITGGGATENFNPSFTGTTKGFSEPFPFRFFPLPNNDDTRARKVGQFFKDYDGGLTGKANTTIIRDIAFLRDGHEYRHPSWRNAARSDYFFAGLWLHRINNTQTPISVVRSKPGTEDACFYESGNNASGTYKFPLIVNQDFLYTFHFGKAPENKSIHLIWNRGEVGDLTLTRFKDFGKLGNFRVNGATRLNSITAVENATDNAYFIAGNGDVYLMLRNRGGDSRTNVFFDWDNNGSFQPQALPCTTNDLDPIGGSNNIPPDVSFQVPGNTEYEEGDDLGVVVDASDSDGNVANVKLYVDNVMVRQENAAPYEWGAANPGQNDAALLNLAVGTYELKAEATDNLGAVTTRTMMITVAESTLSIDDIEEQDAVSIYPNPVRNSLFVSGNNISGKMIKIYDLLGAVRISKLLNDNENEIDFSRLSNGIYMVKVINKENRRISPKVFKIVKTN
ncbi:G8 domain-containing protein [Aquimarina rubra]|uniref:G8 domain-containing protein n=1 Tax=Aquimarina rubra TaxID=1920033 RepID=A0ABW5LGI4_9FLAO